MTRGYAPPPRAARAEFGSVIALLATLLGALAVSPPLFAQVPPPRQLEEVDLGKMPWDVAAVIAASLSTMRGTESPQGLWPVMLSEKTARNIKEPRFRYESFRLRDVTVVDRRRLPGEAGVYRLSALLSFADAAGRRASTSLVARYGFTDRNLVVHDASVHTQTRTRPEVRLFVVPADKISARAFASGRNALDLLRDVVPRALTWDAARRSGSSPRDYYVFAFFQDRLPPDAAVQLRVSEKAEGIGGDPRYAIDLDYDGWRVAVMRATFAFGTGTEFFFKAVYKPGRLLPEAQRTPQLVGVWSSYLRPVPGRS